MQPKEISASFAEMEGRLVMRTGQVLLVGFILDDGKLVGVETYSTTNYIMAVNAYYSRILSHDPRRTSPFANGVQ